MRRRFVQLDRAELLLHATHERRDGVRVGDVEQAADRPTGGQSLERCALILPPQCSDDGVATRQCLFSDERPRPLDTPVTMIVFMVEAPFATRRQPLQSVRLRRSVVNSLCDKGHQCPVPH